MKKCIIVSANNKYVPYLSVLIASVIQNTDITQEIEIVVLYDEIEEEHQIKLQKMAVDTCVQIRFINVHDYVQGYSFFINGTSNRSYLSKEAYFRLLAHEILIEYEKALYLDCDIVVRPGWEKIFNQNLSEYLLAGIQDIWGNWECYNSKSALYKYRVEVLGLKNPLQYFNSGVMLLNLEMMRQTFQKGELLQIAASRDWMKHDQDVLNYISINQVLYLDYAWNMIECPSKKAWNSVPESEQQHYLEEKQAPRIIHYASRKPWIVQGIAFERAYWAAASASAYFDVLLTDFIKEQLSQGNCFEEQVFDSIKQGKIGVKFIIRCALTWLKKMKS